MNAKTLITLFAVLIVMALGANYYTTKQAEQRRLETQAQIQAQMQENERKKQEIQERERQKGVKSEVEQMPSNAREFLVKRFPNPEQQDFSPQPQDSQDRKKLADILQVWTDDVRLAGSTARIALPNVVSKLQDSRRKVEEVYATPCVTFAQAYLYASMDDTINGFLSFMGEDESMSNYYTVKASKNIKMFNQKIDNCNP